MDEKFDSRTIGENPTSQSDEKENRTTSHNTLGMDGRQADPSEHAKKARDPFCYIGIPHKRSGAVTKV